MKFFVLFVIFSGVLGLSVVAQEKNPTQDPLAFSAYMGYAPNFTPQARFVYRNESATFVIDGSKRVGIADYQWIDGRHFRDTLEFDPSRSFLSDRAEGGISEHGYLYRVPNQSFWFFFGDEGIENPGIIGERVGVYYSQNGKEFFRYMTSGGTTRIPFPNPATSAPAGLPSKLVLQIGGFGGPSYLVNLEGGSLSYRTIPPQADLTETVELVTPSAEQWREFRDSLDKLAVWQWRSDYVSPNIADGTNWSAKVEYADKKSSMKGKNGYPKDGAANELVNIPGEVFNGYLAAVEALLGGGRRFR
jgi:hypothetical protein